MKTVLIVEDNPQIQMMLKAILKNQDFEVHVAQNAVEGSSLLHTHPDIKIIICDIMMQGGDGFEFLKRTHDVRLDKNIPVCMLTALNDTKNIVKALSEGADDYIIKPIDKDILIEKLNQVMKGGPGKGFSTVKADFPMTIKGQLFNSLKLCEISVTIDLSEFPLSEGDVCVLSGSKLNEISGIREIISKVRNLCEVEGKRAARLEFIGLMESQRKRIRAMTIKGEEIHAS